MVKSTSTVNALLTGSENASATELSSSLPIGSVQVGPQHQTVAEATNQEGQQVDGWDDGEGGRPVTVVAVEKRRGRRRGGGEEV